MQDSERIAVSRSKPDDLGGLAFAVFNEINYKLIFFLFIIYLFLMSDVFLNRMLSKWDSAVNKYGCPTTFGTIVIGVLLMLFYILIDILIKKEII